MNVLRTNRNRVYSATSKHNQLSNVLKWFTILLAMFSFVYMAAYGFIALIDGDYVRSASGEFAGELGPWSYLVSAVGIDPTSVIMKLCFLLWGLGGLSITVWFSLHPRKAWAPLFILNISSVWYLWIGAGSAIVQIMLLIIWRAIRQISRD